MGDTYPEKRVNRDTMSNDWLWSHYKDLKTNLSDLQVGYECSLRNQMLMNDCDLWQLNKKGELLKRTGQNSFWIHSAYDMYICASFFLLKLEIHTQISHHFPLEWKPWTIFQLSNLKIINDDVRSLRYPCVRTLLKLWISCIMPPPPSIKEQTNWDTIGPDRCCPLYNNTPSIKLDVRVVYGPNGYRQLQQLNEDENCMNWNSFHWILINILQNSRYQTMVVLAVVIK